jgi:hypothetical protein
MMTTATLAISIVMRLIPLPFPDDAKDPCALSGWFAVPAAMGKPGGGASSAPSFADFATAGSRYFAATLKQ